MQSRRERHAYAQQLQRPRFGKRVTPGHAKLALRACIHVALHEPIVILLTNLRASVVASVESTHRT
jgi:hypothetical protein